MLIRLLPVSLRSLLFGVVLSLLLVSSFLIPGTLLLGSLDKLRLLGGEWWRLLTYAFVHVTVDHLVQNVAALLILVVIAYECKVPANTLVLPYFYTVLLVFPFWIFYGGLLAGASVSIMSGFGAVGLELADYGVSPWLFIVLLHMIIALQYFLTNHSDDIGSAYHLWGLWVGVGIGFFRRKLFMRKFSCLREVTT